MFEQKILIVDDKESNLVALESILGTEKPVIRATSGAQALKILLEQDISLLLLDVQMPEMDGFEVANLVRKNPKTKNLPIIFLTAISKDEKFVTKGYRSGAIDYLCKPLKPAILRAKVDFFMKLDLQKRDLEAKIALAQAHLDAYSKSTKPVASALQPASMRRGMVAPH